MEIPSEYSSKRMLVAHVFLGSNLVLFYFLDLPQTNAVRHWIPDFVEKFRNIFRMDSEDQSCYNLHKAWVLF